MAAIVMLTLFALGLGLIVQGGDWFVDSASRIAEASGVPRFIIGATIVSLGTTLPELLVSLLATRRGLAGIAVGNAVGSVTANVGLIMGLSLLCQPGKIDRRAHGPGLGLMVLAIGLLLAASRNGQLSAIGCGALIALLAAHLALSVSGARATRGQRGPVRRLGRQTIRFLAGAAGVTVGARLLVENGAALALMLGVSEGVVGATLVAVGTSLPELVTALGALARRQASLSIGNVVGANIIDLTLILPLCRLLSPRELAIPPQSLRLDMPFCLALSLLAAVPPLLSGRFRRWQGAALLAAYAAYVALLYRAAM